jgi:hypothetical protein
MPVYISNCITFNYKFNSSFQSYVLSGFYHHMFVNVHPNGYFKQIKLLLLHLSKPASF